MNRAEYNTNRHRIQCDICGAFITKANYERHHRACLNGYESKQEIFHPYKAELLCQYCNKKCKNLISLAQHEVRCSRNPNRRDYDKVTKFSMENLKGQTKESSIISKQAARLSEMYQRGEIVSSFNTYHNIPRNYIYKVHNDEEIRKWAEYVRSRNIEIPVYKLVGTIEGYPVVSRLFTHSGKDELEHVFIVRYILQLSSLPEGWEVHHLDKNKTNNSIYNLIPFETGAEHKRFHQSDSAWLSYNPVKHCFNCMIRRK